MDERRRVVWVPLERIAGNPYQLGGDMGLEKLAIEELRRVFDQYEEAANVLDFKAMALLLAGSVVIGGGMLSQFRSDLMLLAFVLAYLALAGACLMALRPRRYKNAIATNWDDLHTHLLQKEEGEAYRILISTYLDSVEANKRANLEKAEYVSIAAVIFILIISGIVVIAVQPVWLVW